MFCATFIFQTRSSALEMFIFSLWGLTPESEDIQSADEGFLFPAGLLPMFFVKTGSVLSVWKWSYSVG